MTEEQVEKAARFLCELAGLDPEFKVEGFDPHRPMLHMTVPLWKTAAQRIEAHYRLTVAINFATGGK